MTQSDLNDFLTIKDFCKQYSSIVSEGSLRWILFNAPENGADCFVRRLGKRKLLISPKQFLTWLESNKRGGTNDNARKN